MNGTRMTKMMEAEARGWTPIITSLIDLDLYKLTVGQLFYNRFPDVIGEYNFTCRNKDKVDLLKYVPEDELRNEIYRNLPEVALTKEEYFYLTMNRSLKEGFLQFLRNFRFNPSEHITLEKLSDTYRITARGPLPSIVLYETMILCIVNEIYERNYVKLNGLDQNALESVGAFRCEQKCVRLLEYNKECIRKGFGEPKIIEFGTRRRFSKAWQEHILRTLNNYIPDNLVGTSNVRLAMSYDMPAIGTFGHEYPMVMQGIVPVQQSQKEAFRLWTEEYKGKFAIALTDTLGDEKFFKDWTLDFAKQYDGVRHDSGDPFAYGEKIIAMYEGFGINPMSKKIVFSDGLDIDTVIKLHRHFQGRIQMVFGIGTNLTNDVGCPVLHIVMKVTESNGQDVCKLSANPAKACCKSQLYIDYVRMAIKNY